jgi:transcription initiation factor IIE alpha subunit
MSDLEVSDSGEESMDELERRIRKMENNLERNLKNLPK